MPSNIRITLLVEKDGNIMEGFPLILRQTVDEFQQFGPIERTGASFVALPTGELGNVQFLLVRGSLATTLRLDNQSDAGVELAAGGLLLIANATIDAGAATNITASIPASTSIITGIAGGT